MAGPAPTGRRRELLEESLLFMLSGVGDGSTYKMIPAIFHAKAQLEVGAGVDLAEADHRAIRRSGALIGFGRRNRRPRRRAGEPRLPAVLPHVEER
jgi:hypothetical protein